MTTKLSHLCRAVVVVATVAFATQTRAGDTPQQVFQEGMYLELGQGDPTAAARLYEQLATGTNSLSELTARAQWRLALCQEKLGNRPQAIALHEALLEAITDTASPELKQVREAAGQSLLEIAEQATQEGQEEVARAIYQRLRKLDLQAVEKRTHERESFRRKLRVVVTTWDQHLATNANVRFRLQVRSSPPPTETIWHGNTDAKGQLLVELPGGRYEVRASAPVYERKYGVATLIPERDDPEELPLTLERIKLPALVHQVYLIGNWIDNWMKSIPLTKVTEGVWETRLQLKPGRYEYKFRINDQPRWITDVRATNFTPDGREDFNALLIIEQEREVTFRLDENDPHFQRLSPGTSAP